MKNIHKILIAFIAVLAVSCTADDVADRPVISSVETPELIAPTSGTEYNLLEIDGDKDADRFVWTAAQYSDDVAINYTLLMDVKDGDFTNAQALATTLSTIEAAITVKSLNAAALALGAEPGVPQLFDIKVKSTVSGGVEMMSVAPITILVNTYSGLVPYDFTDWYLIGAAVQGGWDNNADTDHQPMFRDGNSANKYSFTGFFKAGNFKLISEKGSWASQLGKASETAIQIQDNAGEFTIPADGYYKFTFDTTALTYTLNAFDASASKVFPTVGIIGSATEGGWDADQDMTNSTFNKHAWSIKITLTDGEAKFRGDNDWTDSWGNKTAFSAIGSDGSNIPVPGKSNYIIYFSDLDGSYSMIPNQE